jgi:hypothetical protein
VNAPGSTTQPVFRDTLGRRGRGQGGHARVALRRGGRLRPAGSAELPLLGSGHLAQSRRVG